MGAISGTFASRARSRLSGLPGRSRETGGQWSPQFPHSVAGFRLPGISVPSWWPVLALPVALAVLIPFVVSPSAGQATTMRAAAETILTAFSVVATGLLLHQFSRHQRLTDLLLAGAASTMTLLNLVVIAAPAVLSLQPGGQFAAARVVGGLFAGCALATAAWMPSDRVVTHVRHPVRLALGASAVVMVVAELAGLVLRDALVASTSDNSATATDTLGHPLTFILTIGAFSAFFAAAAGFVRQRRERGAGFSDLLAASALLRAGASASLFLVQPVPAGHVSPSAELRIVALALLLAAAVHRELGARRVLAGAVALAERRRVARDLHDGLAQDLAFIAAHASNIAESMGREHPVAVAARNALAISRGTISELSDPGGATTVESLEAVAEELRDRFGVDIVVNTQLDQELSRPARETVTRITREAIANAARHGDARRIIVSLSPSASASASGVILRVIDDGCGIVVAGSSTAPEGFGLRSIRERAESAGGGMQIQNARRGGTELEVTLP